MKPCSHLSPPPWVTLLAWLDRWRVGAFVGLGVVYLLGINGRWRITSDSALYVLQARAMGGGKADPLAAWGVGATPMGLPAVIAAAGGTPNFITAGFMLAMTAIVLWLTYRLFIEHADRPTATLMVMLVGLSGLVYEMSFGLLTELPFTAGLLLVLWGHERRLKRKDGLAVALGMMVVGVMWMAMFRSVVAVVVGAYVLAEIVRVIGRRDQRRIGLALIGLAAAAGIVLWASSAAVRDDVFIFFQSLATKTPQAWADSVRALMTEALPEAVFGQDVPPGLAWPTSALVVLSMGWLVRARLLWGVLVGVMVLQWAVFLSEPRYVLPVLPVVFYGVWRSGTELLERFSEPWRGLGFLVFLLAVLGSNIWAVVNTIGEQRSDEFYETYRSGKYAAVVELAEVIRRETPSDARLKIYPQVRFELSALADRDLYRLGADENSEPGGVQIFWVGPDPSILQAEVEAVVLKRLGKSVGSAVDRRSGEVWELWQMERVGE